MGKKSKKIKNFQDLDELDEKYYKQDEEEKETKKIAPRPNSLKAGLCEKLLCPRCKNKTLNFSKSHKMYFCVECLSELDLEEVRSFNEGNKNEKSKKD